MGWFSFFVIFLMLVLSVSQANSHPPIKKFLSCFSKECRSSKHPVSEVTYTPENASFDSVLNMRIRNKRYKMQTTPKPLAIITAQCETHVQAAVKCAKSKGIQLRIRSGGHDYEGFSYVSDVPFIILDMFPLQSIDVDLKSSTAWVQAGATVGQLYYQIANKSNVHAFPAGVCVSLGAGGHFSGGGYGNLMRKYGLSVDNVIDAKLVNADGAILDRKSMGDDLFWAIRGGGGASFGVILSWNIKLVPVPQQVTVFRLKKSVEEGATDVIYKWQLVAPKLDNDLFIRAQPNVVNETVIVSFIGQFLGPIEKLIPLVKEKFPELGLEKSDCKEMPWVNTTLFWNDLPSGTPLEALLPISKEPSPIYYKGKSDYVKAPIPKDALKPMWELMVKYKNIWMQWNPYGGRMSEILPLETPFPHREGNLFLIQHYVFWTEDGDEANDRYLNYSRSFYEFIAPHVSSSPREAFLNYRDADIGGKTPSSTTGIQEAQKYGKKFFKENFDRLVTVKTKTDPDNFFSYEQSIPPLA